MILRVAVVSLLACGAVWAQATAQIHGTVKDASGAAVPGAEVKATQTETNTVRTTISGADGGYVLTNLPLGPYQLETSKEGFTKAVESGIVLQVNSDVSVDFALKVGALTEQVNVEANAALVETRSLGVGEVIQTQRIVDLPLNGRNVTDLIGLGGASVQTGTGQTRWFGSTSNPVPVISIGSAPTAGGGGGTSLFGTEYSLDGANHLNFLSGNTMPIAFPDAVQEFKAETTGQTAQRGASTSVSIVTRSGSNEFHGDLFEFLRNDGFGSAREYFSPVDSTYKRNQFGGTVGGPIKKNKLFFFGGYQGTTIRQTAPTQTIVPTAAMLAGNFSCVAAPLRGGPLTVNNLPSGERVTGHNQLDPKFFTPQALYITKAYLNNMGGLQPGACGAVTFQTPTHENDHQFVGKVDYQFSDKQSFFIRSLDTHVFYPPALAGCAFDKSTELLSGNCLSGNMLNSNVGGENQLAHSYAIGHTYLLSSNMVNTFRVAFNRTAATLNSANLFSLCDAGVNMWCGGTPGQIGTTSIIGGFQFGSGLGNGDFWNGQSFSTNEDLSWIRGAHQMAFGFGWWQGRVDEFNHFTPAGANILFTGQATGNGMADFLLGDLSSFLQGLPNAYSSRQNSVDLYFTDVWKINPHLTFTFGLRWEPFLPLQTTNGQISNFDLSRFLAGTKTTKFVNAPPGFYFPGDPGFPGQSSAYRKWAHFDPRGGIAWDPKGDGKTSVRASYAFGYAYVPGIAHEDEGGSNPWGGRVTLASPAGGLASPWQAQPGGNPFPYSVTPNVKFTPGGQFMTTPYDLASPTVYSYNVSLQRQLGSSWVATVTYIGSRIQHLYINEALNYGPIVGAILPPANCAPTARNCTSTTNSNLQVRRVLSQASTNYPTQGALIGNMDTWYPFGSQYYNALLSSIQKRFGNNVSTSANWTWSHCIGYFQGFNSKPEETATNPYNPLFDRGNCDSDRRHIINLTAVAQMPSFSNRLLHTVATGWQFSLIDRYISGAPFSVQDGTDQELSGVNHQRPNLANPSTVYTGHTCGGCFYLNKSAFAAQPFGTIGNLGWNSVTSPAYWDMDLALSRQFRIREKQSLELRADAFNISNSFVPAFNSGMSSVPPTQAYTAAPISPSVPPMAALNNIQFGQILAAFPTRKIQFALKFTF